MQHDSKKILFLINSLKVGGAERVFIKDANSLSEKGVQIFFCMLFGSKEGQILAKELHIPEEHIFYCNARSIFDIAALGRLQSYVHTNNIDVVYSTLNEANLFARVLKIGAPRLTCIIREANVADEKSRKYKLLDMALNIFAEKIVGVSSEVVASLKRYQPWYGYKMRVLMNGVDIPEQVKVYGAETNGPLNVLNVGSLSKKKGQKFLIEACRIIEEKKPGSVRLTIIGSGGEEKNLRGLITAYHLENVVTLLPPLSAGELSEKYRGADVFVLSSLWEGCPNVLLEAMAHGVVSVSTDVGGVRNIVEEGEAGMIVKVGDAEALVAAIMVIMKDREQLKIFGGYSGEIMINFFSQQVHIKKLENILSLHEKTF